MEKLSRGWVRGKVPDAVYWEAVEQWYLHSFMLLAVWEPEDNPARLAMLKILISTLEFIQSKCQK